MRPRASDHDWQAQSVEVDLRASHEAHSEDAAERIVIDPDPSGRLQLEVEGAGRRGEDDRVGAVVGRIEIEGNLRFDAGQKQGVGIDYDLGVRDAGENLHEILASRSVSFGPRASVIRRVAGCSSI